MKLALDNIKGSVTENRLFIRAIEHDDIESFKVLLGDKRTNSFSHKAIRDMEIAIDMESVEIINLLLNDRRMCDLSEALSIACSSNNLNMFWFLYNKLSSRTNDDVVDELDLSFACKATNHDIAMKLFNILMSDTRLNNDSNDVKVKTLETACCNGHMDIIKIILDDPVLDLSKKGINLLITACEEGNQEMCKLLLNCKNGGLITENPTFHKAVTTACDQLYSQIVKLLLSYKNTFTSTDILAIIETGFHTHIRNSYRWIRLKGLYQEGDINYKEWESREKVLNEILLQEQSSIIGILLNRKEVRDKLSSEDLNRYTAMLGG